MNNEQLSGGTEYHADDPAITGREQQRQEPASDAAPSAHGNVASDVGGTPTEYARGVTGSGGTTAGTTNTTVDAGGATGGLGSTEIDPGGSTTLGEGDFMAAGAGGDLQAMGDGVKRADAQQSSGR